MINVTLNTIWHANHASAYATICNALKPSTQGYDLLGFTKEQREAVSIPLDLLATTLGPDLTIWCLESSGQIPTLTSEVVQRIRDKCNVVMVEELQKL